MIKSFDKFGISNRDIILENLEILQEIFTDINDISNKSRYYYDDHNTYTLDFLKNSKSVFEPRMDGFYGIRFSFNCESIEKLQEFIIISIQCINRSKLEDLIFFYNPPIKTNNVIASNISINRGNLFFSEIFKSYITQKCEILRNIPNEFAKKNESYFMDLYFQKSNK